MDICVKKISTPQTMANSKGKTRAEKTEKTPEPKKLKKQWQEYVDL
jgi:hypothetical protein